MWMPREANIRSHKSEAGIILLTPRYWRFQGRGICKGKLQSMSCGTIPIRDCLASSKAARGHVSPLTSDGVTEFGVCQARF